MAAFSEQHPTFLLDSILAPNASRSVPSFAEATTITTETCFSSMQPNHEYLQEIPLHAQIYETSSPHKSYGIKVPFLSCHSTTNTTVPSFTVKQDSVSSTTAVEHQVTQVVCPMKKRKSMEMQVGRDAKAEKERQYSRNPRNSKKKMKKVPEEPPTGYVHVRARRGQATDSHSLAERVRRHKISVRMKLLQSLVPGCDKITGKALILDEIIRYVQTLQSQVEYLAAKLSSVSPIFDDFERDFTTKTFAQEKTYSLDFQLPPVLQSSTTQLTSFPDQKTTEPNSQNLLHQDQRFNISFHDNGNLLWGTDVNQRHGLTDNYGLDGWSSL